MRSGVRRGSGKESGSGGAAAVCDFATEGPVPLAHVAEAAKLQSAAAYDFFRLWARFI